MKKLVFAVVPVFVLTVCVLPHPAEAMRHEQAARQYIVQSRAKTSKKQHGRETELRRNVENPDQYAPDSKIDGALKQALQKTSLSAQNLTSMIGMVSDFSSSISSAMGKIGGFSPGLSAVSSAMGENEGENKVSCNIASADKPVQVEPASGKLLANPIVSVKATSIAGGGGGQGCQPGSQIPCRDQHYQDNSEQGTNPLQPTPLEPESAPRMNPDY